MKKGLYIFFIATLCFFWQLSSSSAQELTPPQDVSITNETTINTEQLEFSPTFYEDGIVFVTTTSVADKATVDKRIDKNIMSIFVARRGLDGILTKPEIFAKELTSPYHEGPLCFDRTAENVFFTRNNFNNGKKGKAKDGVTKLKIYTSQKTNGKWASVREMPFNSDEYDVCHPSINVDGDRIYYASNRPGGYGGMDLYYSQKINGQWGQPTNLGPSVNTDRNEIFPFIHADGTLFFASNGHGSIGGLDIFYSRGKGDVWSAPESLGAPFNTAADDFGVIVDRDKKNGYFTSSRPGGKGGDDIYSFTTADGKRIAEDPAILAANKPNQVTIFVADRITSNEIEGAKISCVSLADITAPDLVTDNEGAVINLQSSGSNSGVLSALNKSNITAVTDKEGKVVFKFLRAKDYLCNVTKTGYQTKQVVYKKDDARPEFMILLDKLGDRIAMNGVLRDKKGKPIPGAVVTILDEKTGEVQTVTTDLQGNYTFYANPESNYQVTGSKDNYLTSATRVSTVGVNPKNRKTMDVQLEMAEVSSPISVGKTYELRNIYYNFNDATLRPDAKKDLDALATVMKQYPDIEIELASHTDSRGSSSANQTLSQLRADNVVSYLASKGISRNRVKAVGYGESQLRNQCADGVACSETEHQYNRRTEFKITKSNQDIEFVYVDKASGAVVATRDENLRGEFCVIAGSFNVESNAQAQLSKIIGLGYSSATIVKPDNLPYNRICVNTFSSFREARALSKQLKSSHNVASFVLKN